MDLLQCCQAFVSGSVGVGDPVVLLVVVEVVGVASLHRQRFEVLAEFASPELCLSSCSGAVHPAIARKEYRAVATVERGGVRVHRGDRAAEVFEEDSGERCGEAFALVENQFDDLVTQLVQVMAAEVVTGAVRSTGVVQGACNSTALASWKASRHDGPSRVRGSSARSASARAPLKQTPMLAVRVPSGSTL